MNLVDYYDSVEKVWRHIEEVIEQNELDLDYEEVGSVFTLESSNGQQIVLNRQEPKRELWLASICGAYHFVNKNGIWVNTQTDKSIWFYLDEALVAFGLEPSFNK